ncbi:DUF5655 domain-containing protein [Microbacterium hydrocarbonoxydans]|uniref:DUF5655 domain-containing protein n=1 Tax=Microbacterium hydrocarbonoxydans TaxID=273678 RepID=UPI0007BB8D1B|nr:DUF5655 domain-containing protein [Microbacterium hydrocarbonoxydans]GAT73745.1 hypothetical protein MHM582_2239 [Microbacterium sp. HM58-2]
MRASSAPEEFFAECALGLAVCERLTAAAAPDVVVRASKSQVSFSRGRGFAFLWLPGRYLRHPDAEVVLSLALDRPMDSPRFKEVVQPSMNRWMHHLEITSLDDVDAEVIGWFREAAEEAC